MHFSFLGSWQLEKLIIVVAVGPIWLGI